MARVATSTNEKAFRAMFIDLSFIMPRHPRSKRLEYSTVQFKSLAPLAFISFALVACSASNSAVTVPALWANSEGMGGIEPAGIIVETNAVSTQFLVDLSDVDANGAGPSWRAATATAAAAATIMAAVDPSSVALEYTITGPIDGPSAGGILAVGTLAAIRGDALDASVTMTGTLSPDGRIGAIGGVKTKIEAAASAGYRLMLIPVANEEFALEDNSMTNAPTYGATLGITVKTVETVSQAYTEFTGVDLESSDVPSLDVIQNPAQRDIAGRMLDSLAAQLPRIAGIEERAILTNQFREAKDSYQIGGADGDLAAYGQAADAYKRALRSIARSETLTAIEVNGIAETVDGLLVKAEKIRIDAIKEIARISEAPFGQGQLALAPSVLRWPIYADAYATAVTTALKNRSNTQELIVAAAQTLAGQDAALDQFMGDAEVIVLAQNPEPAANGERAVTFMRGYATLLNNAADANSKYMEAIQGIAPVEADDIGFIRGANAALAEKFGKPQEYGSDDSAAAVRDVSSAMAWYLLSGARISAVQVFGSDAFGSAVTYAADPLSMRDDLSFSVASVSRDSASLAGFGIDASAAVWGTGWAQQLVRTQRETDNELSASSFALAQVWFDQLCLRMLVAAKK